LIYGLTHTPAVVKYVVGSIFVVYSLVFCIFLILNEKEDIFLLWRYLLVYGILHWIVLSLYLMFVFSLLNSTFYGEINYYSRTIFALALLFHIGSFLFVRMNKRLLTDYEYQQSFDWLGIKPLKFILIVVIMMFVIALLFSG